jgi:hypothetical protein
MPGPVYARLYSPTTPSQFNAISLLDIISRAPLYDEIKYYYDDIDISAHIFLATMPVSRADEHLIDCLALYARQPKPLFRQLCTIYYWPMTSS